MRLHANATTCPKSRLLLWRRVIEEGWSRARAAEAAGVSERTAAKWLARYRTEGPDGLVDRPSTPLTSPVPEDRIAVIVGLRRLRMTAGEIAECLSMPISTVSALLQRIGLGKRSALEPFEPPNRYERRHPGELVHIDIKKLGMIGRAGKRVLGQGPGRRTIGAGWEFVHVAVDDATRLAYVEVLENEKTSSAIGFLRRAVRFFDGYGIRRARGDDGQWIRLPVRHPCTRLPSAGDTASTNPALSPSDERQGRTIHPNDARQLGVRSYLPRQLAAPRRPRCMARLLQSPKTTRQPRPPSTR